MNRKICISCNNIINSKEDFEEYLDDSVNKILRNRKYSGLWIHKNCPGYNKCSLTTENSESKDNINYDIDYYQKLKIINFGKKKYLFDIDNNIAYYYRSSPKTFKKQRASSYVLDQILKKDIFHHFSIENFSIKNSHNEILKINNFIDNKIININSSSFKSKFKPILIKLYYKTKSLEIKNLFHKIFETGIDDLEEHKKMIYKCPYYYIKKILNTELYEEIKLIFFHKGDKINLSQQCHNIDSNYGYMIENFLYKKYYPSKNMKNNVVLVYNEEDKKKDEKYFFTMVVISECNCSYSKNKHFINERIIISLVKHDYYPGYKLEFKQLSDHQVDLITSNNITCTKDFMKDNDKCPLCYKDYEIGEKLIKLSCNHVFCSDEECLKEWLKIKKICPYCNYKI
tara:strand:+ start:568 stop:1764 length:1197 start_codon:yes stop_codon:yes gene_type:complete